MSNSFLDDRDKIAKVDEKNALASAELFGDQLKSVWEAAQKLDFDPSYAQAKVVVVAGMGGSVLGTHVIQTLFKDQLSVPIHVAPDYTVPAFVDSSTLVVGASYSGTTEETLAATQDAIDKGAMVTAVTSGGKLAELVKSQKSPALVFETSNNPCGVARMALGYSIFGQIALLARIGLLNISQEEYESLFSVVAAQQLLMGVDQKQDDNPAKLLAFQMCQKLPVIVTAEYHEGGAHVFANQLNENSKQFSEYRIIPELNHHLMEGLQFPESNSQNLFFFFIESDLFEKQNQTRMTLTKELLDNHNLEYMSYKLTGETPLEQMVEVLLLAAYTSFYLAMLNDQNPSLTPQVDWFKGKL